MLCGVADLDPIQGAYSADKHTYQISQIEQVLALPSSLQGAHSADTGAEATPVSPAGSPHCGPKTKPCRPRVARPRVA
jgi:hypothetical protein